jgi:hypothetical protein
MATRNFSTKYSCRGNAFFMPSLPKCFSQVSTLEGPCLDAARERKWKLLNLEPFTVSERRQFAEKYLLYADCP